MSLKLSLKLASRAFRMNFCDSLNTSKRSFSTLITKASNYKFIPLYKRNIGTLRYFSDLVLETSQVKAMSALSPLDPSSFSKPDLAVIKHISLSLNVDFENKILHGVAVLNFDVQDNINDVILDVRNLTIHKVELQDGTELQYKVGNEVPNFGSKLTIKLPKQATVGEKLKIKIQYNTAPSASALQWLDPLQTSGKKHPYLFSQCQPIHARSILPCQDTPAVKFTYDAEVVAPAEFTVLMSALRGGTSGNKTEFRQPVPIPSYLLAIAVGVLESRSLGPRSLVWSEKEEIERSAWEFAETEKYLQAAERLCGRYEWGQYDLLVLPPSFPYGGMENPCLTFVTPTLLAGDRSQADVIVHEIMHSWTGNLVTNRNFEHFWLNEGFTVFLERKVAAALVAGGAAATRSRDFHSLLGLQELSETVGDFLGATNPLTCLVPDLKSGVHPDDSFSRVPYEKGSLFLRYLEDLVGGPGKNCFILVNVELGATSNLTNLVVSLKGVHPDDAFSSVPYEKGSLFLRYLENLAGGPEVFDDFLRAYLNEFQKKSLDTDQFKEFLLNYFKDNENIKSVNWDAWLYTSGMPPIIPNYDTSMTKAVTALVAVITEGTAPLSRSDVSSFTPHQVINLLQELIVRPALALDRLASLGAEYGVSHSKNSEILYRWLRLCIKSRDSSKLQEAFDFVNNQGRMKYVRPIYRDLYAWEEVRQQTIDNFLANEPNMMHVSAYTLRKDLHLNE
ncbi:LOW QUALITY PROTEIN: leukotriene A-4 hydrolase [Plodia interpunctella]|uniref:LOW QUALITY PROTEIN: leukotriene A-4 hydrolase n=1 Tax=Plodia interpunctella TaxID=58824 RepID=UPI002368CFC1|nr:LOW QUALITY PROTEIN: leukotriene A-4 hydrolase [Plodia interpunctella]